MGHLPGARGRTLLFPLGFAAILATALALGGCFREALSTRTLDATAMEPFAAIIGRDLPLLRGVRIVRTRGPDVIERPFRMITDPQQPVSDNEPAPIAVPAGTMVRFDAARLVRGGVSGTTHPVLLGTLRLGATAYPVEYSWGERRYMNADGMASFGPPLRYLFPLAPWQQGADPKVYTLPEP